MLKSIERLPISTINLVLVSAFLLGALVAAATGNHELVPPLFVGGFGGLASALYARRSGSRDITRINALEYRDERDRTLAKSGLAAVGAVALLMVLVQFFVVITVAPFNSPLIWVAVAQLMVLSGAWSIANSIVVRRG
jgi:hypothetical protein